MAAQFRCGRLVVTRDQMLEWLDECARYFERRDSKGEDRAHWANVHNAKNARTIRDHIKQQDDPIPNSLRPQALGSFLYRIRRCTRLRWQAKTHHCVALGNREAEADAPNADSNEDTRKSV